jgi:hypothetical protein
MDKVLVLWIHKLDSGGGIWEQYNYFKNNTDESLKGEHLKCCCIFSDGKQDGKSPIVLLL